MIKPNKQAQRFMHKINPYRIPEVPEHLEIFHPWLRRDLPVALLERLYEDCIVKQQCIAWPNGQGKITQVTGTYVLPDGQRISFEIAFDLWQPGYTTIWRLNRAEDEPETFEPEDLLALLNNATPLGYETIKLEEEA